MYIIYCFFFNHPATTEIYTLSLHDALPIFNLGGLTYSLDNVSEANLPAGQSDLASPVNDAIPGIDLKLPERSEEHTSELQSHSDLVCRLLLEKKKKHK